MFDKKKKNCVKRIHLVTDDDLYDQNPFYTVKTVFYSSSIKKCGEIACYLCYLGCHGWHASAGGVVDGMLIWVAC